MASRRTSGPKPNGSLRPPAVTPEGRESQLISLAIDAAERQLLDGSASAQVITHFLKLGSSREQLEQERLRHETELLEYKRAALASQQRTEVLYEEALRAMRAYNGEEPPQDHDVFDD